MRKIEKEMIHAIEAGDNWRKANTEVIQEGRDTIVKLHGNTIAFTTTESWYINNCGWITPTTSSRLNALSTVIGSDLFHGVCIKKGSMYIRRGSQLVHMNNCCPV